MHCVAFCLPRECAQSVVQTLLLLNKVVITSSWARLAVKKVYIWCFTGPVLVSLSKNVVLVMIGFIIS